ncbi:hypothetical protein Glove_566g19 [Diversispora epigaea]|uniref:Uncharacterized protein n=1 Tax=Diversispora epigaea TaxID=1348612 RepID=A0A397GA16_9GLOM|nr:hypothetical protein Glove_566g19 [Diversispora epigaea]
MSNSTNSDFMTVYEITANGDIREIIIIKDDAEDNVSHNKETNQNRRINHKSRNRQNRTRNSSTFGARRDNTPTCCCPREQILRSTITIDLTNDTEESTLPYFPSVNSSNSHRPLRNSLKCAICLDQPTDVATTHCGHIFCYDCINRVARTQKLCSICRRQLKKDQIRRLEFKVKNEISFTIFILMANRGGRGGGSCYKCGEPGHLARDCTRSRAVCYNCGSDEHFSRECTKPTKEKKCYKCGDVGHLSRDCYQEPATDTSGSECYKCGKTGHKARNCDNNDTYEEDYNTEYRSRGSGSECYKCGKPGHIARNCDYNNDDYGENSWKGGSNGECYKCGKSGHIAKNCDTNDFSGNYYDSQCYKCGKIGHTFRNCNYNDSNSGFNNKTCYSCGGHGHLKRDCTKGQKCYNCGRSGHLSRECNEAQGSKVCYNCHQEGHIRRDCPEVDTW